MKELKEMRERLLFIDSIVQKANADKEPEKKENAAPVTKLDEAYNKVIETLKEKEDKVAATAGTIPIQLVDILHDLNAFESKLDDPRKVYRLAQKFARYDSCEFTGISPVDKVGGKYIRYHSAFEWEYSILKKNYRKTALRSPILDAKFRVVYAKMINILIDILKDLLIKRVVSSYKSYIKSIINNAKAYLCVRSGTLDVSDVISICNCKHPLDVLIKNSAMCCNYAGFFVRTMSGKTRVVDILDFAGEME